MGNYNTIPKSDDIKQTMILGRSGKDHKNIRYCFVITKNNKCCFSRINKNKYDIIGEFKGYEINDGVNPHIIYKFGNTYNDILTLVLTNDSTGKMISIEFNNYQIDYVIPDIKNILSPIPECKKNIKILNMVFNYFTTS